MSLDLDENQYEASSNLLTDALYDIINLSRDNSFKCHILARLNVNSIEQVKDKVNTLITQSLNKGNECSETQEVNIDLLDFEQEWDGERNQNNSFDELEIIRVYEAEAKSEDDFEIDANFDISNFKNEASIFLKNNDVDHEDFNIILNGSENENHYRQHPDDDFESILK